MVVLRETFYIDNYFISVMVHQDLKLSQYAVIIYENSLTCDILYWELFHLCSSSSTFLFSLPINPSPQLLSQITLKHCVF